MKIVLLVNNNSEYTASLREYIESLGYIVLGNFFTKEKLRECREIEKSAIAIVDHTIEKRGDGVEFVKLIKKRNKKAAIIYTLKDIEQLEDSSLLNLKPYRVLLKPIDWSELKIALRMLVAYHRTK